MSRRCASPSQAPGDNRKSPAGLSVRAATATAAVVDGLGDAGGAVAGLAGVVAEGVAAGGELVDAGVVDTAVGRRDRRVGTLAGGVEVHGGVVAGVRRVAFGER